MSRASPFHQDLSSMTLEADCKFEAGVLVPVIDPMRCEAKGPCVQACPYDVLAIRPVPVADRAALPLMGRLKLFVHGGRQAFVENPDACHGCGLCVQVCPERAIKLQRRGDQATIDSDMAG